LQFFAELFLLAQLESLLSEEVTIKKG
jgi:hypothetical protein